jgi:hypothetical protein
MDEGQKMIPAPDRLRHCTYGSRTPQGTVDLNQHKSALGQKQTFGEPSRMSAIPPKADIG